MANVDGLIKAMKEYCKKEEPKDNKNPEWYKEKEQDVVEKYNQIRDWDCTCNQLPDLIKTTHNFLGQMFAKRGGARSKSRYCKNIEPFLIREEEMDFYKIVSMSIFSRKSSWNKGVKQMIEDIYSKVVSVLKNAKNVNEVKNAKEKLKKFLVNNTSANAILEKTIYENTKDSVKEESDKLI